MRIIVATIGGILGGIIGLALAAFTLSTAAPIDFANANGWYLIGLAACVVAAPILGIWAGYRCFS
jgi:phosphate/sulfate permease